MYIGKRAGLIGLQLFAVIVCYLMLGMPAAHALQISFINDAGQSQATLNSFSEIVEKSINLEYRQNNQYVNIQLSAKTGYSIEKIYLYKCADMSPSECIGSGKPPSVAVFQTPSTFTETPVWYDLARNNKANLMFYVKVNDGLKSYWSSSFTSIEYIGPTPSDFTIEDFELQQNMQIKLKDGTNPQSAASYVLDNNYVPGGWVENVEFSTVGSSSVTKIEAISADEGEIDKQGTMIPVMHELTVPSKTISISRVSNDINFLFPGGEKTGNPLPVYLNQDDPTPPPTDPDCGEGEITSACVCGGTSYDTGYCCSGVYQTDSCEGDDPVDPEPPCADGEITSRCICQGAVYTSGYCCSDVYELSPCTDGTEQTCQNNIKEGTEECDGTDDSACPGKCLSDCTCPDDGGIQYDPVLIVDSWAPQTITCASGGTIIVNLHVEDPGELGAFTGSPAYFYRIGGFQGNPPKISCSTDGDMYRYRCEIKVSDIPNCDTFQDSTSMRLYFNYDGGQRLETEDINIAIETPPPVLRFTGISSGTPHQCGLPTNNGLTARFEVENEPSAPSISYSINGGEYNSISCSGKYTCTIPNDDICGLFQENLHITFKFAFGTEELESSFSVHVAFPPPSMGVDSITPNVMKAGETKQIQAYLHIRNPDMMEYNENDFEFKYLDKPYDSMSCAMDSESASKKYYSCDMEVSVPEGYEGYKTIDFKLRYTMNGVKNLKASYYPLTIRAKDPPSCGNNIKEAGEECDGTDDDSCPSLCTSRCECGEEPPPPPECGNNEKETGEECDGTDDDACPGKCIQGECACPPPEPVLSIQMLTVSNLDCNTVTSADTVEMKATLDHPPEGNPVSTYSIDEGASYTTLTCTETGENPNTGAKDYKCEIPADDICSMGQSHITVKVKMKFGEKEITGNPQPMYIILPEPNMQILYITGQPFQKGKTSTSSIRLFITDPASPLAPSSPQFEYSYDSNPAQSMNCQKTSTSNDRDYYSCDNVEFSIDAASVAEDTMSVIFSVKDSAMVNIVNVKVIKAADLKSPEFEFSEHVNIEGYPGDSIDVTVKGVILRNDYEIDPEATFTARVSASGEDDAYSVIPQDVISFADLSGITCAKVTMEGNNPVVSCSMALKIGEDESGVNLKAAFDIMVTMTDGSVVAVPVELTYDVLEREEKLTSIQVTPADIYCEGAGQSNPDQVEFSATIEGLDGEEIRIVGEKIMIEGTDIKEETLLDRLCTITGKQVRCSIPAGVLLEVIGCSSLEMDSIIKKELSVILKTIDENSVRGMPQGSADISVHAPPLKAEMTLGDIEGAYNIKCLSESTITINAVDIENAELLHDEPGDDLTWSYSFDARDSRGKITAAGDQSGDENIICSPREATGGQTYDNVGQHRHEYYTCTLYLKPSMFTRCPAEGENAMGDITLKVQGQKGTASDRFDVFVSGDDSDYNFVARLQTAPRTPSYCQIQQDSGPSNGLCFVMDNYVTNFTVKVVDLNENPLPSDFSDPPTVVGYLKNNDGKTGMSVNCVRESLTPQPGALEMERVYFCHITLPRNLQTGPLTEAQQDPELEVVEPDYYMGKMEITMTFTYAAGKGVTHLPVNGLSEITMERRKSTSLLSQEQQIKDAKEMKDRFMDIIRFIVFWAGFCAVCYASSEAYGYIPGVNDIDSDDDNNNDNNANAAGLSDTYESEISSSLLFSGSMTTNSYVPYGEKVSLTQSYDNCDSDAANICGDDDKEYSIKTSIGSDTYEACCDSPSDCVYSDDKCYSLDEEKKNGIHVFKCVSGNKWSFTGDGDAGKAACKDYFIAKGDSAKANNIVKYYNSGLFFESGLGKPCCGDDGGYVINDKACCNNENDCYADGACIAINEENPQTHETCIEGNKWRDPPAQYNDALKDLIDGSITSCEACVAKENHAWFKATGNARSYDACVKDKSNIQKFKDEYSGGNSAETIEKCQEYESQREEEEQQETLIEMCKTCTEKSGGYDVCLDGGKFKCVKYDPDSHNDCIGKGNCEDIRNEDINQFDQSMLDDAAENAVNEAENSDDSSIFSKAWEYIKKGVSGCWNWLNDDDSKFKNVAGLGCFLVIGFVLYQAGRLMFWMIKSLYKLGGKVVDAAGSDPGDDLMGQLEKGAAWGLSCALLRFAGDMISKIGDEGGTADIVGEVVSGAGEGAGKICKVILKNYKAVMWALDMYMKILAMQLCFEQITRSAENTQPGSDLQTAQGGYAMMQQMQGCMGHMQGIIQSAEQFGQELENIGDDFAYEFGGLGGGRRPNLQLTVSVSEVCEEFDSNDIVTLHADNVRIKEAAAIMAKVTTKSGTIAKCSNLRKWKIYYARFSSLTLLDDRKKIDGDAHESIESILGDRCKRELEEKNNHYQDVEIKFYIIDERGNEKRISEPITYNSICSKRDKDCSERFGGKENAQCFSQRPSDWYATIPNSNTMTYCNGNYKCAIKEILNDCNTKDGPKGGGVCITPPNNWEADLDGGACKIKKDNTVAGSNEKYNVSKIQDWNEDKSVSGEYYIYHCNDNNKHICCVPDDPSEITSNNQQVSVMAI